MHNVIGHLLCHSGQWPLLQSLDLSCHEKPVDSSDFIKFEDYFYPTGDFMEIDSEDIDESCEKMEVFDAIRLFARADWPKLKHVNLSHDGIASRVLGPTGDAKSPCLESLDLSNNSMSVAAFICVGALGQI